MESAAEPKRGLIYTFYSFKGGVGRSMALANVASLLAKWGKRVLMVDWDLEAPGLEKFFQRWLSGSRKETSGLVDLLQEYDHSPPLEWRSCLLKIALPQAQHIHFISAGRSDADYGARLSSLNWEQLFKDRHLGTYLETLRREWVAEYDYVLIDSRTGITDIGGICTIHLPDVLVCLFTTTEQSIEGIEDVMRRARKAHSALPVDRRRLLIVPIPARDESRTEYKSALEWRQRAAGQLEPFYEDWIPKDEKTVAVLDLLKIPYVAYWSFGERLPVLEEDPDNPDKLAFYYQLLARLILGQLDLKEVKQGGQAARAIEDQRRETEHRVQEAAHARAKAERDAAEHRRAQQEMEEREIGGRVTTYLDERWQRAAHRFKSVEQMNGRIAVTVIVVSLAVYLTTIMPPIRQWWYDNLTSTQFSVGLPIACAIGVIIGLMFFLLARQNRRAGDQLDEERALFEGRAGRYKDAPPNQAVAHFIERSEQIISLGRERTSIGGLVVPVGPGVEAGQATVQKPLNQGARAANDRQEREAPVASGDVGPLVQNVDSSRDPSDRHDVYVSYNHDPVTVEWLREFMTLFLSWLSELLGHRPSVFLEETALPPGREWAAMSATALNRSTCLLAIVTPTYFASGFSVKEWETFARDRGDMIVPILLKGSLDQLPDNVRGRQLVDFRDFAVVGEGFRKTERYVDFQVEVRKLAEHVAELIARAPPTSLESSARAP